MRGSGVGVLSLGISRHATSRNRRIASADHVAHSCVVLLGAGFDCGSELGVDPYWDHLSGSRPHRRSPASAPGLELLDVVVGLGDLGRELLDLFIGQDVAAAGAAGL